MGHGIRDMGYGIRDTGYGIGGLLEAKELTGTGAILSHFTWSYF